MTITRANRPEEISLSYNGGKDCLVLLVLLLAGLAAPPTPPPSTACTPGCDGTDAATAGTPDPTTTHRPLQGIYIAPPDPFPEVEDFVTSSTKEYHLDLTRYALRMRPALEAYLGDRKAVKAIFMGTRRTDPHCEFLTHFSPTDKDWPQFMRVNPMIDWHYTEIWTVSYHFLPPYFHLYSLFFGMVLRRGGGLGEGGGYQLGEAVSDDEEASADKRTSLSGTSAFPIAAYTTEASRRSAAWTTRAPIRLWHWTGARGRSGPRTSWCAMTRSAWVAIGRGQATRSLRGALLLGEAGEGVGDR